MFKNLLLGTKQMYQKQFRAVVSVAQRRINTICQKIKNG